MSNISLKNRISGKFSHNRAGVIMDPEYFSLSSFAEVVHNNTSNYKVVKSYLSNTGLSGEVVIDVPVDNIVFGSYNEYSGFNCIEGQTVFNVPNSNGGYDSFLGFMYASSHEVGKWLVFVELPVLAGNSDNNRIIVVNSKYLRNKELPSYRENDGYEFNCYNGICEFLNSIFVKPVTHVSWLENGAKVTYGLKSNRLYYGVIDVDDCNRVTIPWQVLYKLESSLGILLGNKEFNRVINVKFVKDVDSYYEEPCVLSLLNVLKCYLSIEDVFVGAFYMLPDVKGFISVENVSDDITVSLVKTVNKVYNGRKFVVYVKEETPYCLSFTVDKRYQKFVESDSDDKVLTVSEVDTVCCGRIGTGGLAMYRSSKLLSWFDNSTLCSDVLNNRKEDFAVLSVIEEFERSYKDWGSCSLVEEE